MTIAARRTCVAVDEEQTRPWVGNDVPQAEVHIITLRMSKKGVDWLFVVLLFLRSSHRRCRVRCCTTATVAVVGPKR